MHKGEPQVSRYTDARVSQDCKFQMLSLYIKILNQLALQSVAAALRMLEAESEMQPTFQEELFCSLVAIRRFLGINLLATPME